MEFGNALKKKTCLYYDLCVQIIRTPWNMKNINIYIFVFLLERSIEYDSQLQNKELKKKSNKKNEEEQKKCLIQDGINEH